MLHMLKTKVKTADVIISILIIYLHFMYHLHITHFLFFFFQISTHLILSNSFLNKSLEKACLSSLQPHKSATSLTKICFATK